MQVDATTYIYIYIQTQQINIGGLIKIEKKNSLFDFEKKKLYFDK